MPAVGFVVRNRYEILKILNPGAFGETYLVDDKNPPGGRRCVLKRLKPVPDPEQYAVVKRLFKREAEVLTKIGAESGGRVPNSYDYFEDEGYFCLVQEWIEGQSLAGKMLEGPMSEIEAVGIPCNLLDTLDFLETHGVIHRDIKPPNVILRKRNGKPVLTTVTSARDIG